MFYSVQFAPLSVPPHPSLRSTSTLDTVFCVALDSPLLLSAISSCFIFLNHSFLHRKRTNVHVFSHVKYDIRQLSMQVAGQGNVGPDINMCTHTDPNFTDSIDAKIIFWH